MLSLLKTLIIYKVFHQRLFAAMNMVKINAIYLPLAAI